MIGTTRLTWDVAAYFGSYGLRELKINVVEHVDVRPVDHRILAVAQFKGNGVSEMDLLVRSKRVDEKLGMVKVLFEFFSARPFFNTLETLRIPGIVSAGP